MTQHKKNLQAQSENKTTLLIAKSVFGKGWKQSAYTAKELKQLFSTLSVRGEVYIDDAEKDNPKYGAAISLATFMPDARGSRAADNIKSVTGIPFDFDTGEVSFDDMYEHCIKQKYEFYIYHTHSNMSAKKGVICERFRVLFPYSSEYPINGEKGRQEHYATTGYFAVADHLKLKHFDITSNTVERANFLHSAPETTEHLAQFKFGNVGNRIVPSEIIPKYVKPVKATAIVANNSNAFPDTYFEGFNLSEWLSEYSHSFQMAELLKSKDVKTKKRHKGGYEIHCPDMDHFEHGSLGAFVTNGNDEHGFNISCSHTTCKEKKRSHVDRLVTLLIEGIIRVEDLEDDEFGGGVAETTPTALQVYRAAPVKIEGEFNSLLDKCLSIAPEGRRKFMLEAPYQGAHGATSAPENAYFFLNSFGIAVCKDEFSGRYLVHGVPRINKYNEIDDPALRALTLAYAHFGGDARGFETYLYYAADQNTVHPVREYLNSVQWDGKPRIDTWLSDYCSVENNEYTSAVGRIFLIAAVRRVRDPGCKFDTMPVFESKEGTGKSSVLRILASDLWFTDSLLIGSDDKITIEQTSGSWIVEAPELSGITKKESQHVKAFVSKQEDRARMAYAKTTSSVPRQFVLFGSTNDKQYLMSETGNRRFLPLEMSGSIDLDAVARDRDQIWAEAAHREANGEPITLPEHLWSVAGEEQEKRRLVDAKEDALKNWLGDYDNAFVSLDELYEKLGYVSSDGLSVNIRSINLRDKQNIAQAFEKMGWKKNRTPESQGKISGWSIGNDCFENMVISKRNDVLDFNKNKDGSYSTP